jgi:hypothetical protein
VSRRPVSRLPVSRLPVSRRPVSRRPLGWYGRANLDSRYVAISFSWSNHFFLMCFQIFTVLFIFSLFRILEFLWLSSNVSPNSSIKNLICAASIFCVHLSCL